LLTIPVAPMITGIIIIIIIIIITLFVTNMFVAM
jgi:hypothetical protein